eukprot:CAMPEP_0183292214 /NCGR_PEP_ID=MMETSP0160_2-20130417/1353_1 /TAXON_ID=2839 ORGANISM="Odontella Sinensis, Strain Grunow 1884" /NCGR_SAMPLE_ID=MMETSP0160_2 /ASSEMBLY_ACC=CAM_ASM_000250 /LENGTH=565 /DNA_ID=CAMNT_0025453135 /DNA_START=77 /DNA_END=1777 /DNA_ORIENTATION=-
MVRFASALFLLHLVCDVAGQPLPQWSKSTGATHGVGTAATISPDDNVLYITSDNGVLYAMNPTNGDKLYDYKYTSNTISSTSGVSFSADGTKFVFAVKKSDGTSQVIGMDHSASGAGFKWESMSFVGDVSGTPLYGSGDYVYFTSSRNGVGTFTVLDVTDTSAGPKLLHEESFENLATNGLTLGGTFVDRSKVTAPTEWSPLGIVRNPTNGKHRFGGSDNSNDMVVWAHKAAADSPNFDGYYYAYQMAPEGEDPTSISVLSTGQWATWAPPVFTKDGQKMFFCISRAGMNGWTDAALPYNQGADLKMKFGNEARTGPNPTLSTPALSEDEDWIFYATTKPQIHASKTFVGGESWSNTVAAVIDSGIKVSGSVVYAFASSGHGYAFDAASGNVTWTQPDPADTAEGVKADFSISSDGSMLYFVGVNGAVSKWQIGDEPPTEAPTSAPTESFSSEPSVFASDPPSPMPTTSKPTTSTRKPTVSPVTEEPTSEPTSEPTVSPTSGPTSEPTFGPTGVPTDKPIEIEVQAEETDAPTDSPVESPDSGAASFGFGGALLAGAFWVMGVLA